MKVLIPSYFKDFKCKCKSCRNSCCKNWKIDLHTQDVEKLMNLNDSSVSKFIVIDNKEKNEGFIQKDSNKCCPFIDLDGLCKIQKKYGENMLPMVCRHYPRNIYDHSGYNHLATSNSCEKTIELLLNINKYTLQEADYDFGSDKVTIFDPQLELKQKLYIDLINDGSKKLSDILIDSFCIQIPNYNTNTNFNNLTIFDFLVNVTHHLAKHKNSLAVYHNAIVRRLQTNDSSTLDRYLQAKAMFEHNFPQIDRLLRNILCNAIFYGNIFVKKETEQFYCLKVCLIYIILKFITTISLCDTSDIDKYIDCITNLSRTFQSSSELKTFMSALINSGLNVKEFLISIIKIL